MALTDEQRERLNARVSQNGTDMSADYNEYQEFLRFKEMKRKSSGIEENRGTKYCKYCGAIIPADAVMCPSCRNNMNGVQTRFVNPSNENKENVPIKFDGTPIRDMFVNIMVVAPIVLCAIGIATYKNSYDGIGIQGYLNGLNLEIRHVMAYWMFGIIIGVFAWCLDIVVEIKQSRFYGEWVWWGLIPPVYLFVRASKINHDYRLGILYIISLLLMCGFVF